MGSAVAAAVAESLESRSDRNRLAEAAGQQAAWPISIAFYSILANIPYLIASQAFGFLPLGWFCVEYMLVGIVALFVPRIVTAILLLTVMFADLLCGACLSYYLPAKELLANLGTAHAFSVTRLLCAFAVILLSLLVVVTAFFIPGNKLPTAQRLRVAASLTLFAFLTLGVETLAVYLATGHLPGTLVKLPGLDAVDLRLSELPRIARIPVIRLIHNETANARLITEVREGAASSFTVPSASAAALRDAGFIPGEANSERPNLVLVIVESWGLPTNQSLEEAIVKPLLQPELAAKYEVTQGTVPFHGPTISGEARELCGKGFGFYILVAPSSDLNSCLPARLAASDYDTIAFHGMSGHMFDRANWYRTIGFKERFFREQLKQRGMPDCPGSFIGTCDADIAALIGQRLKEQNNQPYFIHWMTLNSHLPVLVPSPLENGATCAAVLSLAPNSALCSWYQLVGNVHQSVAQIAMGNLARPTIFVIVGDHAPPFADPALRARFNPENVPYIVLVPRSIEQDKQTVFARNDSGSGHEASGREISGRRRQMP